MGDSQARGDPPSIRRLFPASPLRAWAIEFVEADAQREHVVRILHEAAMADRSHRIVIRITARRADGDKFRQEAATAKAKLAIVLDRFDPYQPLFFRQSLELLQSLARPAQRGDGGRKPMPHYRKAVKDLEAVGVGDADAKMLLRALGILVPGPSPR